MTPLDPATLPTLDELEAMFASGQLSTESREITPEERRLAREERKTKAKRNYIGEIGERTVQGWLERRFKRNWRKSPVIPRPNGLGYASTDVDLLGCLGVMSRASRCEVKTTHTNRIPWNTFNRNERRYLAQALQGNEIAFACLVWLDSELKVKFMHAIPWKAMLELETSMSTEFGGKSIKKRDWKRLEQYKIDKPNGRFILTESHWLYQHLIPGDDNGY